jgi:hypothetical protein
LEETVLKYDLTVILKNRPGTLADMGEALGKAGINIDGMCGFPCEGKGVIHILVEDAAPAHRALENAGLEVKDVRQVFVLDIPDKPGELGRISRRIADAGSNIDLLYVATGTRVVFGVDDIDRAKSVLLHLSADESSPLSLKSDP